MARARTTAPCFTGIALAAALAASSCAIAVAAATNVHRTRGGVAEGAEVTGYAQAPIVSGHPEMGYRQLYESNLFVSAPADLAGEGGLDGPSRRLGAPPGAAPRGDGYFDVPALPSSGANGAATNYTLFVSQPEFWIRPKVAPVTLTPGAVTHANVTLTPEYAMMARVNQEWTVPSVCWYQKYKATGTSVTGASFVVAGITAPAVAVAIVAPSAASGADAGNVTTWQVVGSQKEPASKLGIGTDVWTRWRSGEVPTTPGNMYAMRVCANGPGMLQPYKRDDAGGQAFDGHGNAQPFDLNFVVFGDNDGTRVTLAKRTVGVGDLKDNFFSTRWAHTFTAGGSSVAAADVFAAGAAGDWNLTFAWSVHEGGPGGPQIGPTKLTMAAYQTAGFGLHGVSFSPGEAPVKAGSQYAIAFAIHNPPPDSDGFNPGVSDDGYSGGNGVQWDDKAQDWVPHVGVTLCMTIMEYAV